LFAHDERMEREHELVLSPRSRVAIIAAGAFLTWLMVVGMLIGLAGVVLLVLY